MLRPDDLTGIVLPLSVAVTPGREVYAYSHFRGLQDLFQVEGLRY